MQGQIWATLMRTDSFGQHQCAWTTLGNINVHRQLWATLSAQTTLGNIIVHRELWTTLMRTDIFGQH